MKAKACCMTETFDWSRKKYLAVHLFRIYSSAFISSLLIRNEDLKGWICGMTHLGVCWYDSWAQWICWPWHGQSWAPSSSPLTQNLSPSLRMCPRCALLRVMPYMTRAQYHRYRGKEGGRPWANRDTVFVLSKLLANEEPALELTGDQSDQCSKSLQWR